MPFYDFVCPECSTAREVFMPICEYEKIEKKGLACKSCKAKSFPIMGAPAFVERIYLRLSDKNRRKIR